MPNNLLEDIREANMIYLMLAQRLLQANKPEAFLRLGITEDVANIIQDLSATNLIKVSSNNCLLCYIRPDKPTFQALLKGDKLLANQLLLTCN